MLGFLLSGLKWIIFVLNGAIFGSYVVWLLRKCEKGKDKKLITFFFFKCMGIHNEEGQQLC